MQKVYNVLLISLMLVPSLGTATFPGPMYPGWLKGLLFVPLMLADSGEKGHELKLRMFGHSKKMLAKMKQQDKDELLSYYAREYLQNVKGSSSKKYSGKKIKKI